AGGADAGQVEVKLHIVAPVRGQAAIDAQEGAASVRTNAAVVNAGASCVGAIRIGISDIILQTAAHVEATVFFARFGRAVPNGRRIGVRDACACRHAENAQRGRDQRL